MFNSLIVTARLNDVDPQAWLVAILAFIADRPARHTDQLFPWSWNLGRQHIADAA